VLKRFVVAFVVFVAMIVPGAFALALLAAPAYPAPLQPPGCARNLADAVASVAATQARVQKLGPEKGAAKCTATRLYFLEVVKARAVTALCTSGPQRDRELGRLDANVEQINASIAARCR
jgi:hypothetical protein